jgi:hypothetical protein
MRKKRLFLIIVIFFISLSCELTIGGHTWIRDTSLFFSPTELPDATVGQKYDVTITISNNDTPLLRISGDKEELPPGLTINHSDQESTAQLLGIPEIAGVYDFTVRASCLGTNKNGQMGEQSYRLVVRD